MKTELLFLCFAAGTFLTGCGGAAVTKNQYIIDVPQKNAVKAVQPSGKVLEIHGFTIDSEFSGRQIVYRINDFRYVADYYNEFFIPPAVMITEQTRNWLSDSGLFARVVEPGNGITPDYVLNGSIIYCYADIRNKTAPAAILKIKLFLSTNNQGTQKLVWNRTYDMRELMKNSRADSFAAALSRCVENILSGLQEDLQKQIAVIKGG